MTSTIRSSSIAIKRYLKVTEWGVDFLETALIGGRRKFAFGQIDYVLRSWDQKMLSFQVGQEVFSIRVKPGKTKHEKAIDHLISSVSSAQQRVGGFEVVLPAGNL